MEDLIFKIAGTDQEIAASFPVMAELRPHLKRDEFIETIHKMEREPDSIFDLRADLF